jgi:hypothetical protein
MSNPHQYKKVLDFPKGDSWNPARFREVPYKCEDSGYTIELLQKYFVV